MEQDEQDDEDEYETEKAPMTLPQLSIRLGIIIYGELILFPILIQIFSNLIRKHGYAKGICHKRYLCTLYIYCIHMDNSIVLYVLQPKSYKENYRLLHDW